MVAEGHRGPLSPIGRSWDLSRRRGWAVAGLLVIVILVGTLLTMVATAVLGTIFILIGGREGLGPLLVLILNSALITVLMTVLITVLAAIYAGFAEGWTDPSGTDAIRRDLIHEAIFLARLAVELLPQEAEGLGLLALMLHAEARRAAREARWRHRGVLARGPQK